MFEWKTKLAAEKTCLPFHPNFHTFFKVTRCDTQINSSLAHTLTMHSHHRASRFSLLILIFTTGKLCALVWKLRKLLSQENDVNVCPADGSCSPARRSKRCAVATFLWNIWFSIFIVRFDHSLFFLLDFPHFKMKPHCARSQQELWHDRRTRRRWQSEYGG